MQDNHGRSRSQKICILNKHLPRREVEPLFSKKEDPRKKRVISKFCKVYYPIENGCVFQS